jgi:hypothetical protein
MHALLIAVAAVGGVSSPPRGAAPDGSFEIAQLTIRSMTVRIQTTIAQAPPPFAELKETKGPRCIASVAIGGAAVMAGNSVDFILRGGGRVRARFRSSCPALDYYSGFYLSPTADGQICADRDAVRSRAGGECEIDRFRLLVPKHRR